MAGGSDGGGTDVAPGARAEEAGADTTSTSGAGSGGITSDAPETAQGGGRTGNYSGVDAGRTVGARPGAGPGPRGVGK